MEFALSEEQQQLAAAVSGLVAKKQGDLPAGFDAALWEQLCTQIGVAALAIPEEYDGAGFTSFETHVVLESLGASLTDTPLLSTAIATRALLLADNREANARLLPRLAEGAVAAVQLGDGPVLDADRADIVLAVRAGDLVELTGADVGPADTVDQTLHLASVDGGEASLIAGDFPADRLRATAAIATTALQVGGAQRCLDDTVAYLKTRQQFGRPIGSFQALKHRAADLLVQVETARSISWAAGAADASLAADPADVRRMAGAAKSWCSEAFSLVAGEAIQLHGGIAITWEHDTQLYFKRAHALGQLFGRPHEFRRMAY